MRFAAELLWDAAPAAGSSAHGGNAPPGEHPDHERRRAHLAAFIEREFAGSLHRSPFDGRIGTRRRIAIAAAPLGRLHDAARELAGATLNDAVLSIVAGSLRRWLERHHGPLGDVRVRVPVSLHHEGDDAGNRDSFFSVRLPLGIDDPVERLRAVNRETTIRKEEHDAEQLDHVAAALGRHSARLAALVERIESSPREFAVNVSNVPGPRHPVSVLGAPLRLVQRPVGLAVKLLAVDLVAGASGAADAGGKRHHGIPERRRDADPEPLGDHRRLRLAGAGQEHREFVAADPGGPVDGADAGADDAGDNPECLVAGEVPGGVVELLEAVEVEDQQRDPVAGAVEPRKLDD